MNFWDISVSGQVFGPLTVSVLQRNCVFRNRMTVYRKIYRAGMNCISTIWGLADLANLVPHREKINPIQFLEDKIWTLRIVSPKNFSVLNPAACYFIINPMKNGNYRLKILMWLTMYAVRQNFSSDYRLYHL